MNSRITFGAELRYAMHVRGLSLTDVAAEPVIPELLEWVERPAVSELPVRSDHPGGAPPPAMGAELMPAHANQAARAPRPRRRPATAAGQLRIAVD